MSGNFADGLQSHWNRKGKEFGEDPDTIPGKARNTSVNCVGAGCRIGGGPEALFEA